MTDIVIERSLASLSPYLSRSHTFWGDDQTGEVEWGFVWAEQRDEAQTDNRQNVLLFLLRLDV